MLTIFNPEIKNEYYIYAAIIALVIAVFCVVFVWKKKIAWYQALAATTVVTYIFLVLSSTVFCRIKTPYGKHNLELFWSYKFVIDNWSVQQAAAEAILKQIILNFFLLVPVGFLFPLCIIRCSGIWRKVAISTVFSMCVSIAIEVMQLVFHRGLCELDDIGGNTFGAMVASVLSCMLIEGMRWIRSKIRQT